MGSYRSFGLFGIILVGFGLLAGLTGGVWNSLYVLIHLIGGASMLALYVFTHVETLRESVTGRRTQYATNTVVYTVLTLAVVGLVNFMGVRNPFRYDATEQGLFSIAPQTRQLLDGLQDDVEVIAFFRENEGLGAERLLQGYAAESDRFSFRMVDPEQRPELATQYEVTQFGTLVAIHGEDSTRITEATEEALTNALIRLSGAETKRIYFSTGHGEPDPTARDTREGLGQFTAALENEGAEVEPLSLATIPDVPADASLLVVAGPQRPFLPSEINRLERYLDRGGRALFLIEPRVSEGLQTMLASRGIVVGDDVIIDQVVQLFAGPSVGLDPVVTDYGFHPITEGFGQNTLFRLVRSISAADELPTGITVTELVRTSSASWAETNVEQIFETGEVDPDGDQQGPISIAVAATLASSALNWTEPGIDTAPRPGERAGSDESSEDTEAGDEAGAGNESGADAAAGAGDETGTAEAAAEEAPAAGASDQEGASGTPPADLEGRIVVVGDSAWVDNSTFTLMFNEDLALNMVGWLTGGDDENIAIRPRARRSSRISLTGEQGWGVFYLTVLLLPELVLLTGLTIWWRRRR